jgi:hypothetical protein
MKKAKSESKKAKVKKTALLTFAFHLFIFALLSDSG